MGKPSRRDEFPLHLVVALQPFDKWAVSFLGPINPPAQHSGTRDIITTTDYLTRWLEAAPTQDFNMQHSPFLFENRNTGFDFPRSLTSDQGKHLIN
jgi:hypothetical protein